MAPIVVAIVCALISFTIAAGAIGREAHRLDSFSPVPVYDVEQAVAFVAERLPEEVSSRVSFWEVRAILDASRDDQDHFGLSQESLVVQGPGHRVDQLVVVSDDRAARISSSLEQAHPTLLPTDVGIVLAAELEYLRSIGAVGPQAERAE